MHWLRWLLCRLGRHSGYVDGGFHCRHCPFEIPYEHDDEMVDRDVAAYRSTMQLGDDVKTVYPEQWQQDAILKAWNTGKPVVANRPHQ